MKYKTTKKAIREMGDPVFCIGYCNLQNLLRFVDPFAYSTQQIKKLKQLVLQYGDCNSSKKDQILVDILSIVTGEEWDYREIHGCYQGEWNTVYYPAKYWTKESLDAFETMYFNTGSEWIVHEDDTEPTSLEEIDGYAFYCVSKNDEGIKKDLADAVGGKAENVVLYKYYGSVSIPTYNVI